MLNINILEHNIEYWIGENEDLEMDEENIAHVKRMINEGYIEGQLHQINGFDECWGYWKIVKN